jgi:hypothetical protein
MSRFPYDERTMTSPKISPLKKAGDPYLAEWEHDRTSRAGRAQFGVEPDPAKRRVVEADVTKNCC